MSPPPPPKDEPSSPLSAFSPRPIQRQSGSPGPIQPVASSSKLPAFDKEADVTYTSSGRLSRRINYAEQAEPQTDSSSREAGPSMPRAKSLKDDSFKGTKPAKRARSSRDTYGQCRRRATEPPIETDSRPPSRPSSCQVTSTNPQVKPRTSRTLKSRRLCEGKQLRSRRSDPHRCRCQTGAGPSC